VVQLTGCCKDKATDNPSPDPSALPAASPAVSAVAPRASVAIEGQVPSSRTLDRLRWVAGYRYSFPEGGPVGARWAESRAGCRDTGLDLCTEDQWHLACRSNPAVAERLSWTITPASGEGWVTRGGGSGCGARGTKASSSPEAGMIGLCCERRASLAPGGRAPAVLAEANTYVLLVEQALNARDPSRVTTLMANPAELFGTRRSHEEARKALRWTYQSWGKMDSRFIACDVSIQVRQGRFTCETVMTRNRKGGPGLELSVFRQRYAYGPPAQKYSVFGKTTEIMRKWHAM